MIYTLVGVAVTCALLAYIGEEAIRLIGRLSTAVNGRVGIADHQMWSPPTVWQRLVRPLAIVFLGCIWVFLMFRHATRPARRRVISDVLQHIYEARARSGDINTERALRAFKILSYWSIGA